MRVSVKAFSHFVVRFGISAKNGAERAPSGASGAEIEDVFGPLLLLLLSLLLLLLSLLLLPQQQQQQQQQLRQ